MEMLRLTLFGLWTVMGMGHWCNHTLEERVDRVLSPRLQLEVSCSAVYQYNTHGWRLDVDRMRVRHGGDDGIALYYNQQGPKASCFLYKPPQMESQVVNRTVRTCCEGWTGPRCSEGVGVRGLCFSTWSCEEFPGIHNSSLMQMEQCCSSMWGLSWRNASDQTCLSCTYTLFPDSQFSPLVRGGLLGSARVPLSSATCMSWGGSHYRSFDRKHFHFQGGCTYLLASSIDGTWAVYIRTVCDGGGGCSKALKMMFGLDLVSVHHRNLTLNSVLVPNGEALFQNGVSVYWLGDFVFVESGLGVRVKFDLTNTVYLTVTAEHKSATRGLCGVYNGNANDDFTTVSGTVSQYAASFGNSWKVPDQQNKGCNDVAELGHSCDVSADPTLRQQAESTCHRLLENPFTHCHLRLDPAVYVDACLYLYCSLPAKERESAMCDTLANYARECAQQHVIISWRTASLCGRICPKGQVHSDCVSSCPPTCASLQPPGPAAALGQCREECVGGCECPPGLYLYQGNCLKRDDCPCFYRRRTYQSGDRIQQRCNICVCRAGQWHCTGEKCAVQCRLMGGLQVTTFDKKSYTLQGGDCPFTAVEDFVDRKLMVNVRCGEFTGARGGARGGQMGYLKEISVTALHTTVTITDTGVVILNGKRKELPVVTGDLAVRQASVSFLLIQAFGAQLLWYLEGPLALISLQPGFANKVRGLCGTMTWTQHDDFTTPDGDIENSVASFAKKFTVENCFLPGETPADACTTFTQKRDYAEAVCSVIHTAVFQACHDVVEREHYFRLCLLEVCGCAPERVCHCTVITAYAQHCAQEGVAVHWRNQTFCPVQCSGGQVYQECNRACGDSCSDGLNCDGAIDGTGLRTCVPGCQCPLGLVQDHRGQCVPISMCPCTQGGKMYQPGAVIQNNCNTCVCEKGQFNCTQEQCKEVNHCPGSLVYSPRSCLLTCSSLDPPGQQRGSDVAQSSCREPMSGCVCPQGTVLLGDLCVLPDECPCHHNGQLYYTNDTIIKDCNKCVCKERRWHCSQSSCAGVCVATGDPHYVTFDGRYYSFLGDCQYVLVRERSGSFSVTAENVPCGSTGVTCTKSVTLSLGNTVIHLLRGKAVTVNGMPVNLPKSYSGSGLTLGRAGMFVTLSSRLGVSLLWDGGMRVYVRLAAFLHGQVGGLCGNFDGDTENDFTTRQGIIESTAELFGNSWKVSPSCPDVADQDLRDPCALNPHRVTWARKKCAILTQELFSQCHFEVPFQQYYEWCVFDACGCDSGGDCECLCTAIAAYVEECNRRGVYIRWRSQELCPLQCENGLVYDPCGPACSPSCPHVQQGPDSQCGAFSCVEGCFCPSGMVLNGEHCVDPPQCPCEWEGSIFPSGTIITQHCQNCSCVEGLWQCEGIPCHPPSPACLETEFTCAGGRCIPSQWVCDNEDDCGDGSDEVCLSTCSPDEFQCSSTPSGPCLKLALRCNGQPDCEDHSDEDFCGPATPTPLCPPGEFQCASGKCLVVSRVCDGRLDCGFADGSDEQDCGVVCDKGEFLCSGGRCILYLHRCDGHDDCGDLSDERGCVCSPGEFQCPDDKCVPASRVCDGHRDCPTGTDEAICLSRVTCAPDQFACSDSTCISTNMLCDGATDCPGGEDENRSICTTISITPSPSVTPAVQTSVCRSYEFSCDSGAQCVPQAWHCDGETDCLDGSDEQQCAMPCGPAQVSCQSGDQCVNRQNLCDGTPHCRDASDESVDNCGSVQIPPCPGGFSCDNRTCVNMSQVCNGVLDCPRGEDELVCDKIVPPPGSRNTTIPCIEFTCMDGSCIPFNMVCNGVADCQDSTLAPLGGPTDEEGCRSWSSWGHWSPCSTSCGTGFISRQRHCPLGNPLYHCAGEAIQKQQCFNTTCPVDGQWLPWLDWSNCSSCSGVQVRHRGCVPPRYGGRDCSQLPGLSNLAMEIKQCPDVGCANTSCPPGLLRYHCAPCPVSCAHINTGTNCTPSPVSCSSGCWCPEGLVMNHLQQCVLPEECVCEVAGVRYWPGQQMKVGCEICVCERGRPQRCQPNADCSVNCGWSPWSDWGECLGPCGVQSIQWSFRSPNNPTKRGEGKTCRGIYRKARRCQTEPCEECEFQGHTHPVGDRWTSDRCQLCYCLYNLTVQCAPFCPYAVSGCPQGEKLVPGEKDRCCYCKGENDTVFVTVKPVTSKPEEGTSTLVPSYPLPPRDDCWAPLGVQFLPDSSFSASSQQTGHPPKAGRLHGWNPHTDLQGWSPEPENYKDLPQRRPDGQTSSTQNPYVQIDLLRFHNITGVLTQGGGVFGTFVSSFYLQFSQDGRRWYTYKELVTDAQPRAKIFLGNHDDQGVAEIHLDRMVSARFVRLLPHDFQNGIYLRLEIMGCGDGYQWVTTPTPLSVSPGGSCKEKEFRCENGRCVPADVVCDSVNDCGDGSDEKYCGVQPSATTTSPRSCPAGQFSCPPPGGCIPAGLRCDGIPHCLRGEDENGCHPHDNLTTQSDRPHPPTPAPLRTPSMAGVTRPTLTTTGGAPGYKGICSSPLGLEDGRIRYGQLTSSSYRENNPADAGRLNIIPNVPVMEPGWSPLPSDPQPYFQVDFLEPTWVSGVVTQGSGRMTGYLTKYRLAFALHGNVFTDYSEDGKPGSPAQIFEVRMFGRTPVTRWLGWLVRAQYLRIIPVEFRHYFYLRVEILGCTGDLPVTPIVPTSPSSGPKVPVQRCGSGQFACALSEECVSVSVLCDGRPDCKDHSDEINCGTVPTRGSPGLKNQTISSRRPGIHGDVTTPGLQTTSSQAGHPGVVSPGVTGYPGLHQTTSPSGIPGLHTATAPWFVTTPHDGGLPRVLCVEGQFACWSFGCVDSKQVCDGKQDCLDGSDEERCGTSRPAVTPQIPSPCSAKQFSCSSGECVHLDHRCDFQRDCIDGSDEKDCVDCIMSSWTAWSSCSVSCGLGSLFRQRDILREAVPGGSCGGAQFDSRACFPRACPVNGRWSEWTEWSECDANCGGGVRQRNRTCSAPPPKNGGQECEGKMLQTQSCNSEPCTKDVGTNTGCMSGMVLVTQADCQTGKVELCPPTCSHLSFPSNCTVACAVGCRCPYGLFLQDGRCVNASQCFCHWHGQTLQPGQTVSSDQCTTCVCKDGQVTCDNSSCVATCWWSAWSSWSPCDVTCGLGLQQRYRSPVNPAVTQQPCLGDSSEARRCFIPCNFGLADGLWSKWTSWSECSKTCFHHVNDVGFRRRFRSCNGTLAAFNNGTSTCVGDSEEQEHCNTVQCPVNGGWSTWSQWSKCSAKCDSGVQIRERFCSSPSPLHGGSKCQGPHIQTRDCNSHPCSGACPQGMMYMTAAECEAQGGACPRVCLDMTASEVQCATSCYDGCYCAPGFYLLNRSCVPLSQCPCYHQGELYDANTTFPNDACNNCTCINGDMECGSSPCPVNCGWSSWTQWSACSRTCDVGVRRRYRSGTNPPAAFGGQPCKGDRVGIDTCSIEPCFGTKESWTPWSECSVTCGGGYRSRTRGPIRVHGTAQQFSACNLQPCGDRTTCPPGQQWKQCVRGAVSCSDVTMELYRNCTPGCQCPRGTLLQDGVCVQESDCRCDVNRQQHKPGKAVLTDCRNCKCVAGRLVNCSQTNCNVDGQWSVWTPWGDCSVTCGVGLQSRYRFCLSLQHSESGLPCLGPHREDQVCLSAPCDRDGGWGQWSNWTECTKSCGGGIQTRKRDCDNPIPEREGRFCEGLGTEVISCNTNHCPVAPCSLVPGTVFSSCGPSCPRSCEDLAFCEWQCEPGCYCTEGKVLSANGTVCVDREECPCLDLSTGYVLEPGETTKAPDGCNNCTCERGRLNCSRDPCPVSGGWCEWSEWTPCSRTCGAESVTRYRSCSCPEPKAGGASCSGVQELHNGIGVQILRQPCPVIVFCPVHGSWSHWSDWSECEACTGLSTRTRDCNSPPSRFGGLPCMGERRQSRGCHDNFTVCSDCGGGKEEWPCGKPCPHSCSDFHGDTECLDSPDCQKTCGCPGDLVLQDGACVSREDCRCKYPNNSASVMTFDGLDSNNASWVWPNGSAWQFVNPGDSIIDDCKNCSCEAGVLWCRSVPGCYIDGGWGQWGAWTECSLHCGGGVMFRRRQCDNPSPQNGGRGCLGVVQQQKDCNTHLCIDSVGPWLPWSQWSVCSVSCGGGQQHRTRICSLPPCNSLSRQSKTCNTQVCLEVGCPPGRLYRECERGEGCPFNCAQVSLREGCYSDGCEEGCHCPPHTYQHNGVCLQECPCLVDEELLTLLQSVSVTAVSSLLLHNISEGAEVQSGDTLLHDCSSCGCEHGRWNCSLQHCPVHGGLSPWSSWSSCSLSCGGLGLKTRTRACSQPASAHGGRDCQGPRQETTFCQAPQCPGPIEEPVLPDEDFGFSPWSSWSPCGKTCTNAVSPAMKSRQRKCISPPCSGSSHQEKACNLPQCSDGDEICVGADCVQRNCSWTEWGSWSSCSRSCGVGQQQRIRTFVSPGTNGSWCDNILEGNLENRFCNIKPCKVDGGWSRWSPWSRCDKRCGGGRSIRTRSCSSPPPKNGGKKCQGEKNQVKPCNTKPCDEKGCPPGQEFVSCAKQCPQRCADLQQGIECQEGGECQPGCRCPEGQLQQDGLCVQMWQCDCVDSLGQIWAAGSQHQVDCNNCTCTDGQLLCTNQSCQASCVWSSWSSWAPCSVSCGRGQRTRYRSLIPESEGTDCQFEEIQHKSCDPGPCPPLCLHDNRELRVGNTWLQGECKQCTCTPEGHYCQDIDCRVDGGWTPWSVWSDCSVTCGHGTQIRTHACINPPPRNNGSDCLGPERERRDCPNLPCLDDLCPWSPWSSCSQSCGAGSVSRRRMCLCEAAGDAMCPAEIEAERNRQETQLCYKQPCPSCPMSDWSVWSVCSCVSQRQQRYRVALSPAIRRQQCTPVETQSRACSLSQCADCESPFVYSACGMPCEKQCALRGHGDQCLGVQECMPGCYCPEGQLQQNGSCIPAEKCGCVHLQHQASGQPPIAVTVPQGGTVIIDCSTCLCHDGIFQCDIRECEVILSEWSAWTPCSPCLPLASMQFNTSLAGSVSGSKVVSIQRRFRACLDLDSGLPVSGQKESQCSGSLVEERLCPDPNICRDWCEWSAWSVWTACADPCSGGVRQRFRWSLASLPGSRCKSQQTQSQSCNTGLCPGEHCEERGGRTYQGNCANQCPRSCADLWEHVQCLQGSCHAGCRCPEGQLLQGGHCVPVKDCHCGIPSGNGTLEFLPKEEVSIDCNTCVCENGTLACTKLPCPVYEPWRPWSSCSVSCGNGTRSRTRLCQATEGGPSCTDTEQTESCEMPSCPSDCFLSDWSTWSECSATCGGGLSTRNKTILREPEPGGMPCIGPLKQTSVCNTNSCLPECPDGQVFSECSGSCPHICEDLWPHTQCIEGPCMPGCTCPHGQVLYDGNCVPHVECPCSPLSVPADYRNISVEEMTAPLFPPGTTVHHLCNTCVCQGGMFNCTSEHCDVDCQWSSWSQWSPCSASCGMGWQTSTRKILQPSQYGGDPCEDTDNRTRTCIAPECACPTGEQWKMDVAAEFPLCERSCWDIYSSPANCSHFVQGCICQEGLYRNTEGVCVIPALCPCRDQGNLHKAGSEWEEGCQSCRCVNGKKTCQLRCPLLQCDEGEVKVEEPGSCCPICKKQFSDEPESECHRYVQVRNITKGECRLDNVEVSFCRGRCLSRTDVTLEEPYLQSVCDCCSYRLDPEKPVRFLSLRCESGENEPVVLPIIHSCECTSCQGGDLSRR